MQGVALRGCRLADESSPQTCGPGSSSWPGSYGGFVVKGVVLRRDAFSLDVVSVRLGACVDDSGANKLRAAPGNAGGRRRVFYYAASTAFQMAGAALPLRRSLRRLNCPFRIRRASSIPAIVTAAVLNRLNPGIGPMRAFTPQ
jgi:hypothetical protein